MTYLEYKRPNPLSERGREKGIRLVPFARSIRLICRTVHQAKFAEMLGISNGAVQNYWNGNMQPTEDTCALIADACKQLTVPAEFCNTNYWVQISEIGEETKGGRGYFPDTPPAPPMNLETAKTVRKGYDMPAPVAAYMDWLIAEVERLQSA